MAHDTALAHRSSTEWLTPLGLLALAAIPSLAGGARLASFAGLVPRLEDHERFASRPFALALHIVPSLIFAVLGALQFAPSLRRGRPAVHRALGTVLVPAALLAGLSGVVTMLVFPPAETAGPPLHVLRLASAVALLGFTACGALALAQRHHHRHGEWMTRAYAIGIAPGTQALILAPTLLFGGASERSFTLGMAAGWVANLVVAERVIRRRQAARAQSIAPLMKAISYERYGSPDELRVTQVPRPTPGPGQVLVRIEATSLNSLDRRMLRADPFLVRLTNGLFRPTKRRVLGADIAGVIEAIGPGGQRHQAGARVFGESSNDGLGCFAQYVCVRESSVAPIPEGLSATEAASLPLAAGTALQAVRDRARVTAGQHVLIHGAGGGVGAYLVQLARAYGARVTAVCGRRSVEVVRALGADVVLDTTQALPPGQHFDAVFGVNGYRPLREYLSLLGPGGVYVMVGGDGRQLFEALVLGITKRNVEVLTMNPALLPTDLAELSTLVANGALRPLVDRVWPLERTADALRAVEAGTARGKQVLTAWPL